MQFTSGDGSHSTKGLRVHRNHTKQRRQVVHSQSPSETSSERKYQSWTLERRSVTRESRARMQLYRCGNWDVGGSSHRARPRDAHNYTNPTFQMSRTAVGADYANVGGGRAKCRDSAVPGWMRRQITILYVNLTRSGS